MFVGIDIGGTNIKGILTDKSGKILSFRETETPENAKDIDTAIFNLIENLATSASVSKIDIDAVGIGAAGTVDRTKGLVIASPNIPSWKNYPLAKNIEKKTGFRTFIENDATVACAGGWWQGNGTKFRNWIMITLGTGIGGGVVIDNKIYTGQTGSSMEIGHMTIDFDGRECSCGNKGCLEQYASATALVRYVKDNIKKNKGSSLAQYVKDDTITAKLIHDEALNKDEFAIEAMTNISTFLGIGIANLVNIFNPEAIILGGGLSLAHKMIIPVVKEVVKDRALHGVKEKVKYLPIKDQSKIPALGAARIAIDRYNFENQ